MEKIFKNDFDQIISEYLAAELGKYIIDFVDSGNLRKVEYYENDQLDSIEYYKADNESVSAIFSALGTNTLDIITTEVYNQYVVNIKTGYTNGIPSLEEKKLLLDDKVICFLEMNGEEEIDYEFSRKYLYLENDEVLFFIYNTDGTLKEIGGSPYPFSEYNQYIKADELEEYFPNLSTENPYYGDATFLPQ
jgi:hypothetical protein